MDDISMYIYISLYIYKTIKLVAQNVQRKSIRVVLLRRSTRVPNGEITEQSKYALLWDFQIKKKKNQNKISTEIMSQKLVAYNIQHKPTGEVSG